MKPPKTLSQMPTLDQVSTNMETISKILGGNVSFGSTQSNTDKGRNISCFIATGTTPAVANTSFTVSAPAGSTFFKDKHIPIGFITLGVAISGAVLWISSSSGWTASAIQLWCSTASTAFTILII